MKFNQIINFSFISKEVKNFEFDEKYDVIVAGLGSSGVFAAAAASTEKTCVLGIERTNSLGGMSTAGDVLGYYYGMPGGKFEEIDRSCEASNDVYDGFNLHPDSKQENLGKLLKQKNVKTYYSCVILGVYTEKNKVVGACCLYGGLKKKIACKMLIDATSDGYVIKLCGVKTFVGREADGKTVPFTSMLCFADENRDFHVENHDHGYCNQYLPFEFTKRIVEAHSQNTYILENHNNLTLQVAPKIGVREGLRFEGEEKITLENVLSGKTQPKILMYAYSDIDKHGHDTAIDTDLYQNWWVISNLATVAIKIPIPFGAVIPKGFEGIMSTGRCLSADCYTMQGIRMIRDMYRLGEAVGTLAAICTETNKNPFEIDYAEYIYKIKKDNAFDYYPERDFGFNSPNNDMAYRPVKWLTQFNEIKKMLSTETPGVAIWSICILNGKFSNELYELMNETEDELLKNNCAIALGLINDTRALPVLRKIVIKRSCFYFKDSRRSNQFRSVVAICLLARFCDVESLDMLYEIVFSENEVKKDMYHELKPNYLYFYRPNFNFVYFQHMTHAAMALLKIAKKCPEVKKEIYSEFEKLFSNENYIKRVTDNGKDTTEYREIYDVGQYILKCIHNDEQ